MKTSRSSGETMFKTIIAVCTLLFTALPASAETIERPAVKPGDSWAYQITVESPLQKSQASPAWEQKHFETKVIRANQKSILISRKERGSNQIPAEILVGADWRKYRNINGEEIVVNQPLEFPLRPGKSWDIEFTLDRPNSQIKKHENSLTYTVVGWEEVVVPAGKFKAMKIEADGRWRSEIEPSANTSTSTRTDREGTTVVAQSKRAIPRTTTGRLYHAYWYAPEVKYFVKSIEEHFSSNGALSKRTTEELESYKIPGDSP
jgi:hypothetical protein